MFMEFKGLELQSAFRRPISILIFTICDERKMQNVRYPLIYLFTRGYMIHQRTAFIHYEKCSKVVYDLTDVMNIRLAVAHVPGSVPVFSRHPHRGWVEIEWWKYSASKYSNKMYVIVWCSMRSHDLLSPIYCKWNSRTCAAHTPPSIYFMWPQWKFMSL